MKINSAWQFSSAFVLFIGSSGCNEVKAPPERNACADYGALTAALAEATVECTGTIGPDSFIVENGSLKNKFDKCLEPKPCAPNDKTNECPLKKVTDLLALQKFHALPRFEECLTDRHKRWSTLFKRAHIATCPEWKEPKVIGEGSKAASQQHGRMRVKLNYVQVRHGNDKPGTAIFLGPVPKSPPPSEAKGAADQMYVDIQVPAKSSILYTIKFPDDKPNPENCLDPAVCAAQCAAFLPGFVVSAGGNQLLADPTSWFEDDVYSTQSCIPTTTNPWCPPDYVHPMSINSSTGGPVPPGDVYGDRNRANNGERCLRWGGHSTGDYETDLVLECNQSQTICMSRCGN